jgi:hypothetical protein
MALWNWKVTVGGMVGGAPDGAVLTPATGGSLVTHLGTFTFGAGSGYPGEAAVLLNGADFNGFAVSQIYIQDGGQVYMRIDHQGGLWYFFFSAANGDFLEYPPSVSPPPSPPATSPDGTIITAPTTNTVTDKALNVWSFSPNMNGNGDFFLEMNGTVQGAPAGQKLEIAHGGNVYHQNKAGGWWTWNGGWVPTAAP